MEKKAKKNVEQKNQTQKIDFSNVLMEITDQELFDYYSKMSKNQLKILLEKNIPIQDQKIIKNLLKAKK